MNEVSFIKKNEKRWKDFELYLAGKKAMDADKLAQLYIELTDDLAFSKTFFARSKTTKYLNQLTLKAHALIFKRRKQKKNRVLRFFRYDYPLALYNNRRNIYYSFLAFAIAVFVGVVSLQHNQDFVRMILGDGYVDMTLENIEKGKPMAVYASEDPVVMFFSIAWNNIKVSFYIFTMGILLVYGSVLILLYNGVMLGTFQYFLITKGVGVDSFYAIWLHGTMEITAIVIAGGAGIAMGRGFLLPGTLPRITALKQKGKEGAIIITGLIPFFLYAAFIESFLTRHYDKSFLMDSILIAFSVLIIITYFFVYPYLLNRKIKKL
jgi:uncharacterized membrane protein SpoIIM required for sporulation